MDCRAFLNLFFKRGVLNSWVFFPALEILRWITRSIFESVEFVKTFFLVIFINILYLGLVQVGERTHIPVNSPPSPTHNLLAPCTYHCNVMQERRKNSINQQKFFHVGNDFRGDANSGTIIPKVDQNIWYNWVKCGRIMNHQLTIGTGNFSRKRLIYLQKGTKDIYADIHSHPKEKLSQYSSTTLHTTLHTNQKCAYVEGQKDFYKNASRWMEHFLKCCLSFPLLSRSLHIVFS